MPPSVRSWHGRGVSIIQPTDITVTGTAQPPAANVAIQVEVYGLDVNGNVLNGGNPLTVTSTNFLGRYQATFSLPSTMRKDMNSIIVRERAVGFIDGTQTIDPTTLTNLRGNLAINGTTISNLEASLSLQPGTLSNLQGNLNINGWNGDLNGTVAETEAEGEIFGTLEIDIDVIGVGAGEWETDGPAFLTISETEVEGSVSNPNLSGSFSNGTGDESARQGMISDGTGNIAATAGTFTQTGAADIAATTGTVRLQITEYAVSEPVEVFIHQTRGRTLPVSPQPYRAQGLVGNADGANAARAAVAGVPGPARAAYALAS